jgi:pyruvate formate lyase activating enzyme
MNIKGIHKTSLIDYPGKICSILFTGGCNLRCKYCHNPDLASDNLELKALSNEEALSFIRKRSGLIDGISISGGEPTLAKNITDFIRLIKEIPLDVKIDTNGLNPDVIETLLRSELLDYIAIDIKTSPEKYEFLTNRKIDFSRIKQTVDIVRDSGVDYELRTTCIPYFVTLEDFVSIKREIDSVKKYYLQQFVNEITLDPSLAYYEPYPPHVLLSFQEYIKTFAEICEVRGI